MGLWPRGNADLSLPLRFKRDILQYRILFYPVSYRDVGTPVGTLYE